MTQALDRTFQDLRYAVRTLRRSPGFTAIVLAALALGIGATTAIFTVVNSVLLEPLPFPNPGRIMAVREINPQGRLNVSVQTQNFLDWRARNRSFERMAVSQSLPMNLARENQADQVNGMRVSADFFPLLGVQPVLGRWFNPEEDLPGAPERVILSYGFWQRRFGGDPKVLGQSLALNGQPGEVVGIMPSAFALPNVDTDVYIPAEIDPAVAPRDGRNFQALGRLRSGVPLAAAQEEMRGLAVQTALERPRNTRWSATADPLLDDAVRDVRTALLVLLGAVFFVLILCCVNVANLYLMRTYNRVRELTIRHALGARRGRLLQQLVAESLLLTLTGGLLGIVLAYAGVGALLALLPANFPLPRLAQIHVNGPVLLTCLSISVVAGIVFGLVPALVADFRDPANALRHSGRAIAGRRSLLGNALVVAEVALALVLVCGAGLMVRSFLELNRVNPGFRSEHLLTLRMLLVPAKYGPNQTAQVAVVQQMLERIRALPQVTAASSVHFLPLGGSVGSASGVYRSDRPVPAPGLSPSAGFSVISDGYFQTMGIPLIAGREFDLRDRRGAPLVAVINQAAARMLYPNEDPIGKELTVNWTGPPQAVIVGIVADSHFQGIQTESGPFIFLPHAQRPNLLAGLVVRTAGDPLTMIGAVKEAMRSVDPEQGVLETASMDQRVTDSVARPRLQTILLGAFGVLALVLACIGIYGVLAYAVSQRTREMGVRLALGAAPRSILGKVLSEGLRLTIFGLLLGLISAVALTRYLESLLYAVRPTDPAVFAAAIATLLFVSVAACYFPARRAAQVDPMVVLREE